MRSIDICEYYVGEKYGERPVEKQQLLSTRTVPQKSIFRR